MTEKQHEALKLALEALEAHADIGIKSDKAITAIKEALAQPEQDWSMLEAMQGSLREHMARIKELEAQLAQPEQEPVAVVDANDDGYWAEILPDRNIKVGQLLYTTPQQRTWVGLSSSDLDEIDAPIRERGHATIAEIYRAIEAKLREKNA